VGIEVKIALQKENCKKPLPLFFGERKCGQGSNVGTDIGKKFLQVLNLHIWRRNDCLLKLFLSKFPWIDIEDKILFQEKNPKKVLPFFLGRGNCRWGSNVYTDAGKFFLNF
jgi:hypothetical protein